MSNTGNEEEDEIDPKSLQSGMTYLIAPQDYIHIYGRKDGIVLGDKKINTVQKINEPDLESNEKKQPDYECSSTVSSRASKKEKRPKKKKKKHRKPKKDNSSWTNYNCQKSKKFVMVGSGFKKSKSICSRSSHQQSLKQHINLIQNYRAMKSIKIVSSQKFKEKSLELSKKNENDPTWKIAPSDYVHIYKNTLKKQNKRAH